MSPRRDNDPSFFLRPPPAGRSRESRIRLDAGGRFWHDGELVRHTRLSRAFSGWIRRHPGNGRFILSNGFDWCFIEVEATPLFVVGLRRARDGLSLAISRGEELPLEPRCLSLDSDGVLRLNRRGPQGSSSGLPEDARFTNAAQLSLARFLEERDGRVYLTLSVGGQSTLLSLHCGNDGADEVPDTCSGE